MAVRMYHQVEFQCPRCDCALVKSAEDPNQEVHVDYARFHDHREVPAKVAALVQDQWVYCPGCNTTYKIVEILRPETKHLGLVREV